MALSNYLPGKITVTDQLGNSREVNDTPENRELAKQHGFKVDQGIVKDTVDFLQGAEESSYGQRIANAAVKAGADALGIKTKKDEPMPDHTGKITVVDESGGRREITDTPENRAIAEQHNFRIETTDETKAADILAMPENQGARGAGKVFSQKATSEYLFGIPEMIDKSMMSDAEKLAYEKLKDDNQVASVAGSATGIVGNIATPGLNLTGAAAKAEAIGTKALAKIGIEGGESLGKQAIVGAVKGGIAGGVYSAPHALAQAVFEDPDKAAEGMLMGIGTTAALGALGPLAKRILPVIKTGAQKAADDASTHITMKNIGLERGTMKKIGADQVEDIGKIFSDAGVVKPLMTRKALFNAVEKFEKDAGEKISEIESSMNSVLADKPELIASHGFSVSNVVKRLNDEIIGDKVGPYFNKDMKMALDAIKQTIGTATGEVPKFKGDLYSQIQQAVAHSESLSPTTVDVGRKLKNTFYPDYKKSVMALTDRDMLDRHIFNIVTDELNSSVERLATAAERPDIVDAYSLARRQYRAAKQTTEMRANLLSSKTGNKFISPSDWFAGMLGQQHGLTNAISHAAAGAAAASGPAGIATALAYYGAKKGLESTPFQTLMASGSKGIANYLRAISAEAVMRRVEQVEQVLERLAPRVEQAAMRSSKSSSNDTISPIAKLYGGTETDDRKALVEYTKRSDELMANPDKMNAYVGSVANAAAQTGDEALTIPLVQAQVRALQYLHGNIPRQKLNPALFYNPEFRPSPQQVRDFAEIAAASQDPFYLISKIEDGTLTDKHINTIKTIYPQMFDLIVDRLHSYGLETNMKADDLKTYSPEMRRTINRLLAAKKPQSSDPVADIETRRAVQASYGNHQNAPKSRASAKFGSTKNIASKMDSLQQNK